MAIKQIYFSNSGPLVEFDGDLLWIEDLNPHITTKWRMSRVGMVVFGLKAIYAAIFARKAKKS